jgi:hypothetical protein
MTTWSPSLVADRQGSGRSLSMPLGTGIVKISGPIHKAHPRSSVRPHCTQIPGVD